MIEFENQVFRVLWLFFALNLVKSFQDLIYNLNSGFQDEVFFLFLNLLISLIVVLLLTYVFLVKVG